MTPDEQLTLWVAGDPRCPNDRNECCPDFSCCAPELLMPTEQRKAFQLATQEQREAMMMGALGRLVGDQVQIIGGAASNPRPCAECGELKEVRPYGAPGKEEICFACFKKNPGHEARLMRKRELDS